MEIPEINMLCDFEAGIKCLQNPSTIARFFSFPTFWKWGALIFAIFATFGSIIRRIKFIFFRFRTVKPSPGQNDDVFEFSDEEDDDGAAASVASSDDEREGEAAPLRGHDEDFCVRGSILGFRSRQFQNGQLRRRRSCGSGGYGKNVVKLWDSLGFSLGIDEDLFNYGADSVVSTWESQQGDRISDFSGEVWGVPTAEAPPSVILAAEGNGKGDGVIFGGYDRRMRCGVPVLFAEWKLPADKTAGGGGVSAAGVSKVYVRDDVSGVVTVGDVRNVRRPLECVRESDGDTWWDADAVIVENEFESRPSK